MLAKLITIAITSCLLIGDIVSSAPTLPTEDDSNPTEPQLSPAEDLEQFFKDQAHLMVDKQNDNVLSNGNSVPFQITSIIMQIPLVTQIGPVNDFVTILSNLGSWSFMVDPNAVGDAFGEAARGIVIEFLESLKVVDAIAQ